MVTVPATSARYTGPLVIATALPIVLAMEATVAVLLAVPAVIHAVKALVQENNAIFWMMALLPASAIASSTTVLAARILWRASEPTDDYQDRNN